MSKRKIRSYKKGGERKIKKDRQYKRKRGEGKTFKRGREKK